MKLGEAGLFKNGGRVEGDDVDAAHLLANHDCKCGEGGPTDAGDGKELAETSNIVVLAQDMVLDLQLCVDVINVASYLNRIISQLDHRFPRVGISIFLHQPTRRFGAEINQADEGDCWDERSAWTELDIDQVEGGSRKIERDAEIREMRDDQWGKSTDIR